MPSRYLVLDTWLFEKSRDRSSPEMMMKVHALFALLYDSCWVVVLDYDGAIEQEYRSHLDEFAMLWFTEMGTKISSESTPKIVYRPRTSISIEDLDPDDWKFIQVALNTPGRRVVTGDSDFERVKVALFEKHHVTILTIEEALEILRHESSG
jgi:predicted nucleic acid-binding protein